MCEALEVPELAEHPDFLTADQRSRNRVALNEAIAERSRGFGSSELIERLNAAGVPCGPIYKMNEVFTDPQIKHLGMAVSVPRAGKPDINLVGPAMRLSRTPAKMKNAMGRAGEHTADVLAELGYTDDDIAALRTGKII